MDWTIHYGSGAQFSRADGEWIDAPAFDVIAVTWPDPDVNTDYTYGRGFYFFAPWTGRPVSGDVGGLWDYLRSIDEVYLYRTLEQITPAELIRHGVKFGRTISTKDFNAIIKPILRAHNSRGRPHLRPERHLV